MLCPWARHHIPTCSSWPRCTIGCIPHDLNFRKVTGLCAEDGGDTLIIYRCKLSNLAQSWNSEWKGDGHLWMHCNLPYLTLLTIPPRVECSPQVVPTYGWCRPAICVFVILAFSSLAVFGCHYVSLCVHLLSVLLAMYPTHLHLASLFSLLCPIMHCNCPHPINLSILEF